MLVKWHIMFVPKYKSMQICENICVFLCLYQIYLIPLHRNSKT